MTHYFSKLRLSCLSILNRCNPTQIKPEPFEIPEISYQGFFGSDGRDDEPEESAGELLVAEPLPFSTIFNLVG